MAHQSSAGSTIANDTTSLNDDGPHEEHHNAASSTKKRKLTTPTSSGNSSNSNSSSSSTNSTSSTTVPSRSPQQLTALKTIYASLNGPHWTRQNNWLFNDNPSCEFQGIATFRQGDNVKILELSQNNLKGRLDDPIVIDAFAQLGTSLEQLWISENAIEGSLPAVFANEEAFPKLSILDVGSNRLRGSLHPAFANRGTKFGYLDTSGNELTSYFRYNSNDGDGDCEGDGDETIVATPTMETSSPLPHVHVAPTLLTSHQCARLIDLAIRHTKANGGWTLDRHKAYKTTDVDIAICGGQLLEACNDHLKTTILPLMARLFEFPVMDLAIEDLFLAKYSSQEGQQRMLPKHTDDSEISFVITLNDEFKGGGTHFIDDDVTVAPENCGAGVFFCGHRWHSGVEVVEGERYILAGFVRVYPSSEAGVSRFNALLKQTKKG